LKTIIITSISLFISLVAFIFLKPNTQVNDCTQVFETNYYLDYQTQLKQKCQQHLLYPKISQSNLNDLISKVEEPVSNPEQARAYHENFVLSLRKNLSFYPTVQTENKEEERVFLQDLVTWIYTGVDLKQATYHYFYDEVYPKVTPQNSLAFILNALRFSKQFLGSGHRQRDADQYFSGNIPFLLFEIPNQVKTKVLRMGFPLTSSNRFHLPWANPLPYPEFDAFLKNQTHLYVNLMRRHGKESSSSHALEKLEALYPKLSVVTLDKNSKFYTQENYSELMKATHFKKLYLEQLLDIDGNYFWSKRVNKKDWQVELKQILTWTHQHYFANQEALSQKDRLNFIELSYLEILERLTEILQPESINITCRQCMDRAPSLYVLWMLKQKVINQTEAKALLLAPPLLIHNRTSYPLKINRFILASEKILNSKI